MFLFQVLSPSILYRPSCHEQVWPLKIHLSHYPLLFNILQQIPISYRVKAKSLTDIEKTFLQLALADLNPHFQTALCCASYHMLLLPHAHLRLPSKLITISWGLQMCWMLSPHLVCQMSTSSHKMLGCGGVAWRKVLGNLIFCSLLFWISHLWSQRRKGEKENSTTT